MNLNNTDDVQDRAGRPEYVLAAQAHARAKAGSRKGDGVDVVEDALAKGGEAASDRGGGKTIGVAGGVASSGASRVRWQQEIGVRSVARIRPARGLRRTGRHFGLSSLEPLVRQMVTLSEQLRAAQEMQRADHEARLEQLMHAQAQIAQVMIAQEEQAATISRLADEVSARESAVAAREAALERLAAAEPAIDDLSDGEVKVVCPEAAGGLGQFGQVCGAELCTAGAAEEVEPGTDKASRVSQGCREESDDIRRQLFDDDEPEKMIVADRFLADSAPGAQVMIAQGEQAATISRLADEVSARESAVAAREAALERLAAAEPAIDDLSDGEVKVVCPEAAGGLGQFGQVCGAELCTAGAAEEVEPGTDKASRVAQGRREESDDIRRQLFDDVDPTLFEWVMEALADSAPGGRLEQSEHLGEQPRSPREQRQRAAAAGEVLTESDSAQGSRGGGGSRGRVALPVSVQPLGLLRRVGPGLVERPPRQVPRPGSAALQETPTASLFTPAWFLTPLSVTTAGAKPPEVAEVRRRAAEVLQGGWRSRRTRMQRRVATASQVAPGASSPAAGIAQLLRLSSSGEEYSWSLPATAVAAEEACTARAWWAVAAKVQRRGLVRASAAARMQAGWRAAVARRVFARLQLERRRVEARVRLAAREAEEAGKREVRKLSREKAQWRPKGKPKRRRGGVVPAGEDGGH